ncbi:MAG: TonB-dependent copper receptor [Nitrospirae bacterium]|nr:TonB-dependent copper receptor [Magnetococcales bacterium]
MKNLLVLSALCALWVVPVHAAESSDPAASSETQSNVMDAILVEDTRIVVPSQSTLILEDRRKGPVTDGGDLLKTFPGVSGGRMGGHGMEPTIRGQNQSRLNVLLDGSFVHGGCPNRMDPPSSYGTSETYDEVEVIKGSQTVTQGSGGSGGTVLFKRQTERFTDDAWYRGRAGGGYQGNANIREGFFDLAVGNPTGYLRAISNVSVGDDYEDGDGHAVRSAYDERTGNFLVGLTPSNTSLLELGYEATRARDVLYAGAGMDTPQTDHDAYRMKFGHHVGGTLLKKVQGQISYSAIEHLMDNYSLRTPPSATMAMRAPSTSDTWSGRMSVDLEKGLFSSTLGVDIQDNQRDAVRYRGTTASVNAVQSYLWPDVTLTDVGVFSEAQWRVSPAERIKVGLRYDRVEVDADKINLVPNDTMGSVAKLSAANLYTAYYGAASSSDEENNLGGLVRLERDMPGDLGMMYLSFSRSVRTADATERYLASNNNSSTSSRWVGNPFLEPEKHHQLEVGLHMKHNPWDLDTSVYYNDVADYILRDRDHNAHGAGNATIYRNVQATLYGGEMSLNRHWAPQWTSGVTVAYVHADNDSDNRPLAQTPPLEGALTTDYDDGVWNVGAKLRLAARQNRVDADSTTGSGVDVGKTAGFQTTDLYAGYLHDSGIRLKLGVNNVWNEDYAEHLNLSNTFDSTQVQVDEPGRSFWLTASMAF